MTKDEKRFALGAAVVIGGLLLYKFAKAASVPKWVEEPGSPPMVPTGRVRISAVQPSSGYDPILTAVTTQPFDKIQMWTPGPGMPALPADWPADDRDPARTRVEAMHTGIAFPLPGARVWSAP